MYYDHSPVEILNHIKQQAKEHGDSKTEDLCSRAIKQIERSLEELSSATKELHKPSAKESLEEIKNQLVYAYDVLAGLWEVD